jgi:ribosomal-protein-alanine N-acetyltransferase
LTTIETPRLVLRAVTNEVLRADLASTPQFGAMLGAEIPPDWPPDPNYDADAIRYVIAMQGRDPTSRDWGFRYFLLKGEPRQLVGAGGYAAPAANGEIEIGYAITPTMRRRGLASEAARALTARAFALLDVERVIAHTLPDLAPSIGVLEKCGFRLVGSGKQAGAVSYAVTRAHWRSLG